MSVGLSYEEALKKAWAEEMKKFRELEAEFWFGPDPEWEVEFWDYQESRPRDYNVMVFPPDYFDDLPVRRLGSVLWEPRSSRLEEAIQKTSESGARFLRWVMGR